MTDVATDLDIRSMPEYGQAMATFTVEKNEAEGKGDQIGVLQAENKLHQTLSQLKDRRFAAIQASTALQTARAAVVAKYPAVRPEAYAHIQDPAQIDAYVKNLQEMIDTATGGNPAGATKVVEAQPQSWGAPPATNTGTATPPGDEEWATIADPRDREMARVRHLNKLSPVVLQKGRNAMAENLEVRRVSTDPIISRVIANASQRDGFDYETGEKL